MQRLQSIDILKLFAMFMVIWGHCVQFLLSSHYLDEPAYLYIYSFHMPLFMMISGLFVHHAAPTAHDLGRSLLTRARQLLLPCLSWGLLMSLGNLIQPILVGTHSGNSLLFTLIHNFWFLKSLFICFALWYIALYVLRVRWLAIVISMVVSQFIPAYEVQWMYPSFAMGILLGGGLEWLRSSRKIVAAIAFVTGLALLLQWSKQAFMIPSVYRLPELSSSELLHAIALRLYRFAVNISLSLGFIALFLGLDHRLSTQNSKLSTSLNSKLSIRLQPIVRGCAEIRTLNYLAKFGQMTLGIYILHSLMIIARERLCPTLLCCDSLNPWLFNIAVAPLLAAVLLLVCGYLTRALMRLPYCSFFLLGTPWPKQQ